MAAKDKEESEKEGEAGKEAPKKKSKKMLFLIIGVVVVLAIIGGVLAVVLGGGAKAPEEEAQHEQKEETVHLQTAKLEPIIVNLSESSSFLKVTMVIEFNPAIIEAAEKAEAAAAAGTGAGHGGGGMDAAAKKEGGLPPMIEARQPMVLDAIIRVLSSKKAEEVLGPDGKERLKEELIQAINEAIGLEEGPVVNIYFSEFIIQ